MEQWQINKTPAHSRRGVVASQHYKASDVGAEVLAAGGNAMDAAIATSFAIGVVEPWMSGIGGGGLMIVAPAGEAQSTTLSFNMRSSEALRPQDYPMVGGMSQDLFSWPKVRDDRNVHGPLSVAVPGQVAGMAAAHERYGSMPWSELLAPAISLCRDGLEVDWMATVRIAAAARSLRRYDGESRYLPQGEVPAGQWAGPAPRIQNPALEKTLEQLALSGGDDFYRGDIASVLLNDASAAGVTLTASDLSGYRVSWSEAGRLQYKDGIVDYVDGLSGGPSLASVLDRLEQPAGRLPDESHYLALARALSNEFDQRLESPGDTVSSPGCTTHISVVDADGFAVSLTQTLLSVFGSKLELPGTGMLMNNGIMWFDPEPGKSNSLAPGRFPLCNMNPVIVRRGEERTAIGASGGRRIVGAVTQICSWLLDFDMDLEQALYQPRIDVSGSGEVLVDERLDQSVHTILAGEFAARSMQSAVYPNVFACPNAVSWSEQDGANGMPFIYSPLAAARGA